MGAGGWERVSWALGPFDRQNGRKLDNAWAEGMEMGAGIQYVNGAVGNKVEVMQSIGQQVVEYCSWDSEIVG